MSGYARRGNQLWEAIDRYLRGPAKLYYRVFPTDTKGQAQMKEATLLRDYEYDWNVKRNIRSILERIERDTSNVLVR